MPKHYFKPSNEMLKSTPVKTRLSSTQLTTNTQIKVRHYVFQIYYCFEGPILSNVVRIYL